MLRQVARRAADHYSLLFGHDVEAVRRRIAESILRDYSLGERFISPLQGEWNVIDVRFPGWRARAYLGLLDFTLQREASALLINGLRMQAYT